MIHPVNDPINAPAKTSVVKWFPEVTRKTAVAAAPVMPIIQIGWIKGESGFLLWKTEAAKTETTTKEQEEEKTEENQEKEENKPERK